MRKQLHIPLHTRFAAVPGLAVVLLASLLSCPLVASAQSSADVVLPPVAPPGVTPQGMPLRSATPTQAAIMAPQAATVASPQTPVARPATPAPQLEQFAQPAVLPPDSVGSLNPAATLTPRAELIDVVLPAAPERPPVGIDLKPSAPKNLTSTTPKAAKKPAVKASDEELLSAKSKLVDDPFAGVVGTPVSDSQLNRFVFPEPVEGVYFQEGAPLPECPKDANPQDPCKPVFLNGRRMMLLQLRAGAQGPVQMLVHLRSGRMTTINLAPARGPGAVVRVDGAEDGASDTRLAEAKSQARLAANGNNGAGMVATEQDVALLARFARGDIPAGFEPEIIGKPVRYDLFDVVPMATWSNGSTLRAHLMQVRPHGDTPVAVNPGLFRTPRIKALALDRDTITAKAPAMLYILEQLPVEAQ